jgi:L-ascorbate metabolism protein UlaG (beta-lactamase superfamily)
MGRTQLPEGGVALWYLGQSGFVAKGGGHVVYFDPYLSDYLEQFTRGRPDEDPRHFHPPLQPADVTNADLVFGSHWHYDHIDPGAVLPISKASPACRFVVPLAVTAWLAELGLPADRVLAVAVDDPQEVVGVKFVSIPAAHETLDFDPELGYPYRGYVVTLGGVTIYHAGDCVPYDGLVERLRSLDVDIALLPINGRDYFRLSRGFAGNFTYREAAELVMAIDADLLIPMHVGMHLANTEHPGYLVDYLADQFPQQKCHFVTPGERVLYLKNADDGLLALTS